MIAARARRRGGAVPCPVTADLFAFADEAPRSRAKAAALAAFRDELTAMRAQLTAIRNRLHATKAALGR